MNIFIYIGISVILSLIICLFFFINYQILTVLNRMETVMKLMENTIKQADATIQAHGKMSNMLNE